MEPKKLSLQKNKLSGAECGAKMRDNLTLPPVGLGMWNYGGLLNPDHSRDHSELKAIEQAISLGYRHFDTAEMYGAGHSEELLGRALVGLNRSDFIITSKVKPENLSYQGILSACDSSLKRLQTDFIDLYLIHWPSKEISLADSFHALNRLVSEDKVRNVGVSNFDLPLLEEAVRLSETPLFGNQVLYSLFHRKPQFDGTLEFCQEHELTLTAYSPLRNCDFNHPTLVDVSERLSVAPQQLAINWLIRQRNVVTIPKSSNRERQRDNLESVKLEVSEFDQKLLDDLIRE